MAKYNKKIVKDICSIIEKDSYTIPEICKMVGIDEATYHRWKIDKNEFCEAIEKARDKFIKHGLIECEKSLMKLIIGYEYEESKTVVVNDGSNNPKIKEKSTIKKHVSPNLGAVIHFQTNKDPDNWKNKQSTELTGKDGKDLIPTMYVIGDDDFIKEFNEKLQAEQATGNEHSDNKT